MSLFNILFAFVATIFTILGASESTKYFWILMPFALVGFFVSLLQLCFLLWDFLTATRSMRRRIIYGFKKNFIGEKFELNQLMEKSKIGGKSIYCNPFKNDTAYCFHDYFLETTEGGFESFLLCPHTEFGVIDKKTNFKAGKQKIMTHMLRGILLAMPSVYKWNSDLFTILQATYNNDYDLHDLKQMNYFSCLVHELLKVCDKTKVSVNRALWSYCELIGKSVDPSKNAFDEDVSFLYQRLDEHDYLNIGGVKHKHEKNQEDFYTTIFDLLLSEAERELHYNLDFANCRVDYKETILKGRFGFDIKVYVEGRVMLDEKYSKNSMDFKGFTVGENHFTMALKLFTMHYAMQEVYQQNRVCCFISNGSFAFSETLFKKEKYCTRHCLNFKELYHEIFNMNKAVKLVASVSGYANVFEGFYGQTKAKMLEDYYCDKISLIVKTFGDKNKDLLFEYFEAISFDKNKRFFLLDILLKNLTVFRVNKKLKDLGFTNWQMKRVLVDLSYFLELAGTTILNGVDLKMNPRKVAISIFKNKVEKRDNLTPYSTKRCIILKMAKANNEKELDDPEYRKTFGKRVEGSDLFWIADKLKQLSNQGSNKKNKPLGGNIKKKINSKLNSWGDAKLVSSTNIFTGESNRKLSYAEILKKCTFPTLENACLTEKIRSRIDVITSSTFLQNLNTELVKNKVNKAASTQKNNGEGSWKKVKKAKDKKAKPNSQQDMVDHEKKLRNKYNNSAKVMDHNISNPYDLLRKYQLTFNKNHHFNSKISNANLNNFHSRLGEFSVMERWAYPPQTLKKAETFISKVMNIASNKNLKKVINNELKRGRKNEEKGEQTTIENINDSTKNERNNDVDCASTCLKFEAESPVITTPINDKSLHLKLDKRDTVKEEVSTKRNSSFGNNITQNYLAKD